MTFSFTASRSYLCIRVGGWEVFAQRETAPAAHYGVTRDPISGGTLDLPGVSISWASQR